MTEHEWLTCDDPARMLHSLASDVPKGHRYIGQISRRSLRLFAVACCRQVWHLLDDDVECPYCKDARFDAGDYGGPLLSGDRLQKYIASRCACGGTRRLERSRRAVEVAERYADRTHTPEEWGMGHNEAADARVRCAEGSDTWHAASMVEDTSRTSPDIESILRHQTLIVALYPDQTMARRSQVALLRDIVGNPWLEIPSFMPPDAFIRSDLWGLSLGLAEAAYDDRASDGTLDPVRLMILADALEEAGCTTDELLAHLRSPGLHVRGCWALDLVLGKE